jgi:ATP-binding cassette subfamily C protein CydC
VRLVLLLAVDAVGRGALDRVPLDVLVLTALAAFEAVAPLPAAAAALAGVRASGQRLFAVLDAPAAVPAVPLAARPVGAGPHTIELIDARLRYGPGEPWALDGVDLRLPPGRRIALMGPSGSGKSTLAAVLFRFRDLDAGSALLDGAPLTDYDPDDVRRVIGGMPADSHLFDTTIRENLRLARPDATDADLADAARRALPAGLDRIAARRVGHRRRRADVRR